MEGRKTPGNEEENGSRLALKGQKWNYVEVQVYGKQSACKVTMGNEFLKCLGEGRGGKKRG